ncbi:MAG: D-alanyl-D-alanine carboxypeptidase [Microbacteriaceae bacterium]|nr:D-alanyl-D-alanine carboxypeptidase [Microbacteriaceae bacterium]
MPSRRQIYRRRRIVVFGGLLLVLSTLFYLPMTLLAPLRATEAVVPEHVEAPGAAADLDFPGYGASAVGAIGFPGVLAASGSGKPLPIASITKIVTALVVLQEHPLGVGEAGPKVTMTSADVAYHDAYLKVNGTVEPVKAGQVYTQRELLDLTLIESANNYATTLAVWAFGSEDAFATAARGWLEAHGLSGITVSEPTGLSSANRATASDLVELARIALADPLIAEIVGTRTVTLHDVGKLENSNELLGMHGVTGIKTGTLDPYGANLLFSADALIGQSTVTIVGVVLGGVDHPTINRAIVSLLASVQAGFHELDVSDVGEDFGSYETPWGQTAAAEASAEAVLLTWGDTPVTVAIEVDPVRLAPAGERVGQVVFTAGSRSTTVPLVLSEAITDPGPGWRLTHPGELF